MGDVRIITVMKHFRERDRAADRARKNYAAVPGTPFFQRGQCKASPCRAWRQSLERLQWRITMLHLPPGKIERLP